MKILFTRKLPEKLIEPLKERYTISMWTEENDPMPRELLLKEVADADAIFTNVADQIDKELIEQAKSLKVISTMAVGYDNIDIDEATKRRIPVGHTPGVLSEATADLTFALLMATGRRITEGMDVIRRNEWKSWGPFLLTGQSVYGATIGIIGMGRIGQGVARRAKGFNMNILYHNRSRNPVAEEELGATYCSLEELLQQADYVVLLAPSTPETRRMIGREQFALMKKSSIFINTSRGTNVDEQALYEALKSNEIFAAGLDVFETEPITADHPLLQLDNVVALPHIGSADIETRMVMGRLAIQNIEKGLAGERLIHCVNEELYK
ncbi:2-hydroxyacid dehydrogenase [Halalkalibacterium ligniniphilum]|uniref:2-hydroxyacid dehydrogenase n=1 Tax=Halalkalibacterium ligniniphilum TaxID=1134413 RepID=UPI00034A5C4C|nr:D-glycerate dehydrogenase [Halalkalibacterium ligniniphilum]